MTICTAPAIPTPAAPVAALAIMPRDSRLVRHAPPAEHRSASPATVPPVRTKGDIGRFSSKSRARLTLTIRNVEGLSIALVINYGAEAPTDDRIAKSHLNKLLRWLTAQGISLVWRQEWSATGRVHWHLLLSDAPDGDALTATWAAIIRAPSHRNLIHLSDVRDHDQANRYLVKAASDRSNVAPQGYANMGRYWGKRTGAGQPPLTPPVVEAIADEPARLAPVVRIARKLARRAAVVVGRRPPRRDGGMASLTLWDVGGNAAAALRRYFDALPVLRPDLFGHAPPWASLARRAGGS